MLHYCTSHILVKLLFRWSSPVLLRTVQESEEMPTSFKSIFKCNRVELKAKIKVTDALLGELLAHQLLRQQNVDYIVVGS